MFRRYYFSNGNYVFVRQHSELKQQLNQYLVGKLSFVYAK